MLAYYSKNCKGGSIVIDVPAFVMSCSLVRPGALLSTRRIPAAPPHSQKTPVSPGAGHGQGPLPRDREDSIGMPFARFQRTLAVLPQGSITRRCAPFRCFRPVFSVRGSDCGSTGDFRSCSHVTFCVAGINKTFLEKVIAFRQQLWYVLWLQKRRCRNVRLHEGSAKAF